MTGIWRLGRHTLPVGQGKGNEKIKRSAQPGFWPGTTPVTPPSDRLRNFVKMPINSLMLS